MLLVQNFLKGDESMSPSTLGQITDKRFELLTLDENGVILERTPLTHIPDEDQLPKRYALSYQCMIYLNLRGIIDRNRDWFNRHTGFFHVWTGAQTSVEAKAIKVGPVVLPVITGYRITFHNIRSSAFVEELEYLSEYVGVPLKLS